MEAEERLKKAAEGDTDSKVWLGDLCTTHLNSEFGKLLKCLLEDRLSLELQKNMDGRLSSDRVLGRVEQAHQLWLDLQQFIQDKDHLLAERPVKEEAPSQMAEEPIPDKV